MADDTAGKQPGRRSGKPFEPGHSGNPNGRPAGSRNAATVAVEILLEGEAEAIGRKAVELALAGDTLALRLVLERIAPVRRSRPVPFQMPEVKAAGDIVRGIGAVLQAAAAGDLAPDEAATIAGILETKRRAIEMTDLEQRLSALEKRSTDGESE